MWFRRKSQESNFIHLEYPVMIRLYRIMDSFSAAQFLTILMCIHATSGQRAEVSGPTEAAKGTNASLTCTVVGGTVNVIQWFDDSPTPSENIYSGSTPFSQDLKYRNFKITSLSATESVMTIENAEVEDDGAYRCDIPTGTDGTINVVVEAASIVTLTLESIVMNDMDMYQATCDAVGGKPQETITWKLNGMTQTDGNGNTIVPTNPPATPPLSNTKSVFTFPATPENNNQTLVCETTGHTLTELDGQESRVLNIHSSPSTAGTIVTVHVDYSTQGMAITVSCNAVDQPNPEMRNYYIYSNDSLIYESANRGNQITVSDPVVGTNYTCLAGNYLGNTSSEAVTYVPISPTTPSPTTDSSTAEGTTTETPAAAAALSIGEIIGIVIGAILGVIIIVLVIYFVCIRGKDGFSLQGLFTSCNCCLRCCNCCLPSNPPPRKNQSAVGTSNGSEKNDVELAAPLNGVNEVVTEDKIKPVAAPRDQGSIQHTTDNPGQAEYAMVDRKKPGGGDMPDTRGSGQKEPQGMLYADLDLSASAGHTEKKVPQNKDDVVVYSSILV